MTFLIEGWHFLVLLVQSFRKQFANQTGILTVKLEGKKPVTEETFT